MRAIARRTQRAGLALSAIFGAIVGLAFASRSELAWQLAFGGFVSLLWVGMAVVVLSAAGLRVPAGALRQGLALSCKVFLAQCTIYGAAALALSLAPIAAARMPLPNLALAFLPGLFLCNTLAVLLSLPLYLQWIPVPHDQ